MTSDEPNPATSEVEFRHGVASVPFEGNSLSIGGWILLPPII